MLEIIDYEAPTPKRFGLVVTEMRNSWQSQDKSDSTFWDGGFSLGPNDQALAQRLVNTGTDHGKWLRQLSVYVVIRSAEYFFREFDTYVVGVVPPGDVTQNSTSQMHTLAKHPFAAEMFCFDSMPADEQEELMVILNRKRDRWLAAGKRKGPEAREWRAMLQATPDSWIYRRGISLNYQVLRGLWISRHSHRLSEWRTFTTWIESLPYANLITSESTS